MKILAQFLAFTAIAAIIGAIWRPDYLWQLLLTAAVCLMASIIIAALKAVNE